MSTFAATQWPLSVAPTFPDARLPAIAIPPRSGACRRRQGFSLRAVLGRVGIAAVAVTWPSFNAPAATTSRPWRYVLTVQGEAPQRFGPFADATACNLSLAGAMADLDARLPGLYVVTPCTPSGF